MDYEPNSINASSFADNVSWSAFSFAFNSSQNSVDCKPDRFQMRAVTTNIPTYQANLQMLIIHIFGVNYLTDTT
jgi:hypothetical protein